jgi:hypothetical protein
MIKKRLQQRSAFLYPNDIREHFCHHSQQQKGYNYVIQCLCGLVVRVLDYTTEMYCVSCDVRTEFMYVMWKKVHRLCGLVVRVPDYTTEMYCASCEVQTDFMYVMWKKVDRLCGLVVKVLDYRYRGPAFDSRALPEKKSSGSGTGSTQPREYN